MTLYNTNNHKYLANGHETFGISLVWSSTPRYEWRYAEGGTYQSGFVANLYNTSQQAYLINHGGYYEGLYESGLGWIHAPFALPSGYVAPKGISKQPVSVPGPRPAR